MKTSKLPIDLYQQEDVVALSRALLGKLLCTSVDGALCKAIIRETEAYAGETDRASHAYGGRRTPRTEIMYAAGGCAYVYLCYGIHHLFNVVSNREGVPHAILVRAAVPVLGRNTMRQRRGRDDSDLKLLDGPGKVAEGLGITTALSGTSLRGDTLWLEDAGIAIPAESIVVGPRVGVDYAGEDAALPYRFRLSAAFAKSVLAS
ncbi:MAG: DNA-3-methyladenine glycosylase [Woeseia sp.]